MSQDYLEFSEVINDLSPADLEWWQAEYARVQQDEEDREGDCTDFVIEDGNSVWLHGNENGNVDAVADVVQRWLKETGSDNSFTLQWSETCSKPMAGAFAGGAVVVTAEKQYWMTTGDFVAQCIAAIESGKSLTFIPNVV